MSSTGVAMDSINSAFSSSNNMFGLTGGAAEALMCAVVTMIVLRLELQRRDASGPSLGSRQMARHAETCKRLLRQCAPEAIALLACLSLAALLRARGDLRGETITGAGFEEGSADAAAWEQIKSQWPLLLTADTLLSLQAMLRLVILVSVVLRASGGSGPVPLSDEASALWLGAGVARAALLARSEVYTLDGPLGGSLPAACEIAVLPILLMLSRNALRRAPLALAMVLAAAVYFASRNYLSLAGDQKTDGLFVLAHSLEFLSAFAYLFRTVLIDNRSWDVSVGFAHLLMPVQQGLAAYYWLQAFEFSEELVGAGFPFAVLQIGCCAQLGAYLGASALHFADALDSREV